MTIHPDPQLNDADMELLSAYIDRRLDDGEQAALEQRLNAEPNLRGALEELRATVALLRDLEPLKPPRSFTIAAPAAAPRRGWSFAWPAIGSALVAMVCLLTFSYVLTRSGGSGSTASAPAPAAMQEAAAPTAAPAAGGAAQDTSAMRQSAAATAAPAEAAPAEAPAAPMTAQAPGVTAAPAAEAPMAAAEAPMATPAATTGAEPSPAPAEAPVIAAAPTAAAASGAAAAEQPSEPAPSVADSAQAPLPNQSALKSMTPLPSPAPVAAQGNPQSATAQQGYNAQVATSGISSPGTVTLEQPPARPVANNAPGGGSSNAWLIAAVLALLVIGVGVGLALRRRA